MFLSKKKISMKHQGWNINENNVNKLAVVSHFPDIIKGLLVADRCSYSELCLSCSSHYITNENKTMMATPKRAKKKKKLNHDRGNLHASRVNTPSPIFTWSLWVQAVQSWGKTTKKTHRHIYTHTHSLHSDTLCCCCCYCLLSLSLSFCVLHFRALTGHLCSHTQCFFGLLSVCEWTCKRDNHSDSFTKTSKRD